MADYILWGKDPSGLSFFKSGNAIAETANKTWTRNPPESIEDLLDNPNFAESNFAPLGSTQFKTPPQKFDRAAVQNSYLAAEFESLFRQIDETELTINYYELKCGKRTKPPRPALIAAVGERAPALFEHAQTLNQYAYLKLRHLLVELRRQQFTMRDSITTHMLRRSSGFQWTDSAEPTPINVAPAPMNPIYYKDEHLLAPQITTLPLLAKPANVSFDFSDPVHLARFAAVYGELPSDSPLIRIFKFYCGWAHLTEAQTELLHLKFERLSNLEIANRINKKYKRAYTENYISTIYRQRILARIAAAAQLHKQILEQRDPAAYKRCCGCGHYYLRDSQHFMRKARSRDGLAPRCKHCTRQKEGEV